MFSLWKRSTIALRCECGALRGEARDVSPLTGTRLVCICDDCQSYAHFLEREQAILDASGGTDIFQLTPAQLRLTEGRDQLRCMRLCPKGVVRWYAGCCNTPVANSAATPRMPFVGVPTVFFALEDEEARLKALGGLRAKIHGRFSRGAMPADAHAKAPLTLLLRTVRLIGWAALRGRHEPSPFFDSTTGRPVVEPRVLSKAEREALRARLKAGLPTTE